MIIMCSRFRDELIRAKIIQMRQDRLRRRRGQPCSNLLGCVKGVTLHPNPRTLHPEL